MQQLRPADFAPDLSPYSPRFTDYVVNVIPQADGYGPFKDWEAIGASLGAQCRGAITVRKTNGTTAVIAFTATAAFTYASTTGTWTNITRLVGGAYATSADYDWSMAQFDDINGNYLVATNGVDTPQYINVDVLTNFADLPNAPTARFVVASGDFLVLLALFSDPLSVAWCGVKDSTYWTYTERGSDVSPIPDGGPIMGAVGSESGVVIFQAEKIRIMQRVPSDVIFTIKVLHEKIGCLSPGSIVSLRNTFFWYDQGGFYSGIEANPIGDNIVNKFVTQVSSPSYLRGMKSCAAPDNKMVWWLIASTSTTKYLIGYNWTLKKWTYCETDVDYIFRVVTPGYTIDDLGTLGYTIDTIPYPVDSVFWAGSAIESLAGFSASGAFGYFENDPRTAVIDTADVQFVPGGFGFLHSVGAMVEGNYANVTIQIGTRENIGTDSDTTWWPAETLDQYTGLVFPCLEARTHRIRTTIVSSNWKNFTGLVYSTVRAGEYGL